MSRFGLICQVTSAFILSVAGAALACAPLVDCLFASPGSELPGGCSSDPYKVSSQPAIRSALTGLSLQNGEVHFYGCERGRFSTRLPDPTTGIVRVSYPLSPSYRIEDYVGALAHELGHAVQLRDAGSLAALRTRLRNDSARVELGADFLAGLIFKRHMRGQNQQSFEQSLELLGNYQTGSLATHSTPEARTTAFRMGYYYQGNDRTLEQASADFQSNRFATILREIIP